MQYFLRLSNSHFTCNVYQLLGRTRHNSSINIMDHVLNPTEQLFMAV